MTPLITSGSSRNTSEQPVTWIRLLCIYCLAMALPSAIWSQSDDPVETHYESGELFERFGEDSEGKKTGKYERFALNGTLTAQAEYKSGLRHGSWREFANGELHTFAKYHRDQLHGRWEEFHPGGERKSLANYSKGVLHGNYNESRPKEDWVRTAKYKKGLLEGKAKIEVKNKVVSKRVWKGGHLEKLDDLTPYPLRLKKLAADFKEANILPALDQGIPFPKSA